MTYEKINVPAGQKITYSDGRLHVPDNPIVAFIEGDGIGVDITPASVKVMDAAVARAQQTMMLSLRFLTIGPRRLYIRIMARRGGAST